MFNKYLTPSEQRSLLATIKKHKALDAQRDAAWMELAVYTGIRVSPLTKLTVGDARRALASKRFVIRAEINKRHVKSENALHRNTEDALRDLLKIRAQMGCDNSDFDAPLLVSIKGKRDKLQPLTPRALQIAMRKWARLAGLACAEEITPHWLRHTLAKRIIASSTSNNPLGIVRAVLGHKSIATTAIYVEPDKDEVDSAILEVA
ncbi:tyrosine-type recombinase/integrase [Thiolinea disciformis]|uniref:tyrosine-type recombinase/integrase n=1 Tax=Thiolinea disciformis TaxID=125614 RepID=UPI00037FAA94|nr:site-specific integrase [Thiolinea disciformis]